VDILVLDDRVIQDGLEDRAGVEDLVHLVILEHLEDLVGRVIRVHLDSDSLAILDIQVQREILDSAYLVTLVHLAHLENLVTVATRDQESQDILGPQALAAHQVNRAIVDTQAQE
jgi:hypothetical protein